MPGRPNRRETSGQMCFHSISYNWYILIVLFQMKRTATEIIEKTAGPREFVRKVGIISVVIYLCLVGLDFYFKANASPDRTTTENLAVKDAHLPSIQSISRTLTPV